MSAIVLLLGGCQQDTRSEGMPELHPVTLAILQADKPLAEASVRLIPEDSASPWYSGGTTDNRGIAIVQTGRKYQGVPAGSYKVTVSKIEMPTPASSEMSPLDGPRGSEQPAYDLVAAEYTNPNQTPLQITVAAGDNTHEFDLGAAVRIERKGPPSP